MDLGIFAWICGGGNRVGNRAFQVSILSGLTNKSLDDGVIPIPESSDLSLMTDRVGKGWFSMLCHGSELIGSGIRSSGVVMSTTWGVLAIGKSRPEPYWKSPCCDERQS